MLYSEDNNFLLIKNHKVGGTSLELTLSMYLPDNAIVTPKTSNHPSWVLKEENNYLGYNPRNYDGFYNHMSYQDISNKIDVSSAKSYVFVRNPFDAVLSHFFHRLHFMEKDKAWDSLPEFEKNDLVIKYFNDELGWTWHRSTKNLYLSELNKVQVSEILKYENGVEEEINKVLPNHNLPLIRLNVFEKAFRPKHIKYTDVFSDVYLDKIYQEWSWEFKNLGYK